MSDTTDFENYVRESLTRIEGFIQERAADIAIHERILRGESGSNGLCSAVADIQRRVSIWNGLLTFFQAVAIAAIGIMWKTKG